MSSISSIHMFLMSKHCESPSPSQARDLEMRAVVRVRVLSAFNSLVGSVLSVMVPVTVFAWYTLVNRKALDAATGLENVEIC